MVERASLFDGLIEADPTLVAILIAVVVLGAGIYLFQRFGRGGGGR